jgi:hypothetical protein
MKTRAATIKTILYSNTVTPRRRPGTKRDWMYAPIVIAIWMLQYQSWPATLCV